MTNAVEGLHIVTEKMLKAEENANRKKHTVHLVAVSKTFDASVIIPVLADGHRRFGENRVQEAKAKWPALRQEFGSIELHLIGPLQSNKVHEAVSLFDVIETVDRQKIAEALAVEMKKQNKNLKCFVQVNTGLEPQKAGVDPRQTVDFVDKCRALSLNIVGLMCIPPVGENPGPHFALLQKLAAACHLEELSMGMSHDFETAIRFGATNVRVGSAIFGHRD